MRALLTTFRLFTKLGGTVLFLLAAPTGLYGYLDPGTGSLLAQLAAAVVFGSLLAIKQSWRRITGLLRGGRFKRSGREEPRGS